MARDRIFPDQKYNRLAIQKLCKDARVLDCFTHTGSFALNAGFAGATEVIGVDASELGVHQAELNAKLNGLENTVRFLNARMCLTCCRIWRRRARSSTW